MTYNRNLYDPLYNVISAVCWNYLAILSFDKDIFQVKFPNARGHQVIVYADGVVGTMHTEQAWGCHGLWPFKRA